MLKRPSEIRGAGVYLLFARSRLAYVGETGNAKARLSNLKNADIDGAYLLKVKAKQERKESERLLIQRLDPPGNKKDAPTPASLEVYSRPLAAGESRRIVITLRLPGDVYEAVQAMAASRRTSGEKVGEGASILGVVCDAVMAYREKETR